jgi:hypothetical protein
LGMHSKNKPRKLKCLCANLRPGPTSGCRRHGQGSKRERRNAVVEILLK